LKSATDTRRKNRASKPRSTTAAHGTKTAQVLDLLGRPDGATIDALMDATGWQAHSVRGFLSGTVKKRLKLPLQSMLTDRVRHYRIDAAHRSTWDCGTEMADHKRFSLATDIEVYFCDPRSPWRRGSNEQINGLLRQYFPKGMDLSDVRQNHLNAIARRLNERPRKTPEYYSPAEQFAECVASID
jgi:IS30 family transposase